ncbi:MAG: DUF5676 family membrane protein [Candidatus Binatia bacterium]
MRRIEPYPVAVGLSFVFLIFYLVCVVLHFLLPETGWQMFRWWEMILYGFTWLTMFSLVLGAVEVFLAGFFVAYILIPLYNYFDGRFPRKEREETMKPLRFKPIAFAVTSFGVITYVLCIIFDLIFPQWAMYELWEILLPGFVWLSWGSFFIGLIGVVIYGFYIAAVFVPIYNYFGKAKLAELK